MQLSPVTLTLAMFLIPYHWLKGLGFQEGSPCLVFYTLGVPSWAPLAWLPFVEELGLPSLALSPHSSLNASLFWMLPPVGNCR